MRCTRSTSTYKTLILEILKVNDELDYASILKRLEEYCSGEVNRFLLRKALAELVRENKVVRKPGYSVSKHLFSLASPCKPS